MGGQKNRLTDKVLLSTHMVWLRNKKIKFSLRTLNSSPTSQSTIPSCVGTGLSSLNQYEARIKVSGSWIQESDASAVTGKGMRHSPIKNGNVTSFFAMDASRSLSDFYDHFRYEIGEYEIGEY